MATREWTQFDIEAAAEATAIHALRKMRPQGIKPKKAKGVMNHRTVANARLIDNLLLA